MYIYLNVDKQMTDVKLSLLYGNTWNNLTVYKKLSLGTFKNVIDKMFTNHIYLIYMYKKDLV